MLLNQVFRFNKLCWFSTISILLGKVRGSFPQQKLFSSGRTGALQLAVESKYFMGSISTRQYYDNTLVRLVACAANRVHTASGGSILVPRSVATRRTTHLCALTYLMHMRSTRLTEFLEISTLPTRIQLCLEHPTCLAISMVVHVSTSSWGTILNQKEPRPRVNEQVRTELEVLYCTVDWCHTHSPAHARAQ